MKQISLTYEVTLRIDKDGKWHGDCVPPADYSRPVQGVSGPLPEPTLVEMYDAIFDHLKARNRQFPISGCLEVKVNTEITETER